MIGSDYWTTGGILVAAGLALLFGSALLAVKLHPEVDDNRRNRKRYTIPAVLGFLLFLIGVVAMIAGGFAFAIGVVARVPLL